MYDHLKIIWGKKNLHPTHEFKGLQCANVMMRQLQSTGNISERVKSFYKKRRQEKMRRKDDESFSVYK